MVTIMTFIPVTIVLLRNVIVIVMTIMITFMVRIRNRPGPDRPLPVKRLILADPVLAS